MSFANMLQELKESNEGKIVFINSGAFFIAIEEDAVLLHNKLGLKCSCFQKNTCKIGVPINSLDKYLEKIEKIGYGYIVYCFDREKEKLSVIREIEGKENELIKSKKILKNCQKCDILKNVKKDVKKGRIFMARRASRYDENSKLNVKKVVAVIVFILVIVMFVIGIKFLLTNNTKSTSGKIEATTYYTVYDNGKWGVIDSNGESVINATYDEMIVVPDSTKAVFICIYDANYIDGTYKTKVINDKENEIFTGYDKAEAISSLDEKQNIVYKSNILRVQKNGKYGLTDFSGKKLLECVYDEIESLQGIENSILIKKDGTYGLCDDLGNVIIDTKYKEIKNIEDNYKNGYIVVDENNQYGIIGFDKKTVLECDYEDIKPIYSSTLFIVKVDGKYLAIQKDGSIVIQDKFEDVTAINGDYIVAKNSGKARSY